MTAPAAEEVRHIAVAARVLPRLARHRGLSWLDRRALRRAGAALARIHADLQAEGNRGHLRFNDPRDPRAWEERF